MRNARIFPPDANHGMERVALSATDTAVENETGMGQPENELACGSGGRPPRGSGGGGRQFCEDSPFQGTEPPGTTAHGKMVSVDRERCHRTDDGELGGRC